MKKMHVFVMVFSLVLAGFSMALEARETTSGLKVNNVLKIQDRIDVRKMTNFGDIGQLGFNSPNNAQGSLDDLCGEEADECESNCDQIDEGETIESPDPDYSQSNCEDDCYYAWEECLE